MFFVQSEMVGAVAQLGERLNGIQEVVGSIPISSTNPPLPILTDSFRAPAPASEREDLRSITARRLDRASDPRQTVLLIALGVLAAAGIGYGLVERSRRTAAEEERAAIAGHADSLEAALADRDSLLAGRPTVEELLAVLAAPDVAAFPLAGAGEARGSLIASPGGAILSAHGLPRSPEDAYVLWHVDDAGPHLVAELGTTPDGRLFALLDDAAFATGWGAIQIGRGTGAAPRPSEVLLEYRGFLR